MLRLLELKTKVQQKQDLAESFNEFKNLLRDEKVRESDEARELLEPMNQAFILGHARVEVAQALINFTADSDVNRDLLRLDEGFWNEADMVLRTLDEPGAEMKVADLLVILMAQFMYNVGQEHQEDFNAHLTKRLNAVLAYIVAGGSEEEIAVEILSEIIDENQCLHERQHTVLMQKMHQAYHGEDPNDELCLYWAIVYQNMACNTAVDAHSTFSFYEKVPEGDFQRETKRRLFGGQGNTFLRHSYNNWANVEKSVDYIMTGKDSFGVAAAAIDVGNCICNKEDQERMTKLINDKCGINAFVERLVTHQWTDIVQSQYVHCLTNLMQPAVSTAIFAHWRSFAITVKAACDNYGIVPEAAAAARKLLKKLALCDDSEKYTGLWAQVHTQDEVLRALLQKEAGLVLLEDRTLRPLLIAALFDASGEKTVSALLEQLHAQALFFSHGTVKDTLARDPALASAVAGPFVLFLLMLHKAFLEQVNTLQGFGPVVNNAGFVVAKAKSVFSDNEDVVSICDDFLRFVASQVSQ